MEVVDHSLCDSCMWYEYLGSEEYACAIDGKPPSEKKCKLEYIDSSLVDSYFYEPEYPEQF